MKLIAVAGSIALNLALAGTLALHPSFAPAACRDFIARHSPFASDAKPVTARPAVARSTGSARPKLWSSLDTAGDLPALIARLRAAGFPPDVIREMLRAEVNARYDAKMRAITDADVTTPYWKPRAPTLSMDARRMADYAALQRERAGILRDLFKDPFFSSDDVTATQRRQFGNLSRQKIDQIQRIEDDYNDMAAAIRAGTNGLMLAEDREKLALLAREKKADLAAALTPDELADYEVRSSPLTNILASQLGGFNPTEAEFLTVFRAQQAFGEKMTPTVTGGSFSMAPMNYQDRQAIQQQLNESLSAALGAARYADYARETDPSYQMLTRLAQRENIAPATAIQAFNVRDGVAEESTRIANDAALSGEAKLAALQSLAQSTRSQLLALLGPTAGPAYVTSIDSQWLKMVERGNAVTFTGGSSMTISMGGTTPLMMSFGSGSNFRSVVPPSTAPPRP